MSLVIVLVVSVFAASLGAVLIISTGRAASLDHDRTIDLALAHKDGFRSRARARV